MISFFLFFTLQLVLFVCHDDNYVVLETLCCSRKYHTDRFEYFVDRFFQHSFTNMQDAVTKCYKCLEIEKKRKKVSLERSVVRSRETKRSPRG